MEKHLTLLGVLYIGFSSLCLLAAVVVFMAVAGGGLLSGDSHAIAITTIVGSAIAFFLVIISAPGIIGGIGILRRYGWARILLLILGALNLLNIPFGTALGIYTFWVLLNNDTTRLFSGTPVS